MKHEVNGGGMSRQRTIRSLALSVSLVLIPSLCTAQQAATDGTLASLQIR